MQENAKLRQELETALRSKKENIKLNGMLKTGQDALKAEQELVSKLRAQLAEKSKVTKQDETMFRNWQSYVHQVTGLELSEIMGCGVLAPVSKARFLLLPKSQCHLDKYCSSLKE